MDMMTKTLCYCVTRIQETTAINITIVSDDNSNDVSAERITKKKRERMKRSTRLTATI